MASQTLLLTYVLFVFFVFVHTLEEISCDIFSLTVRGHRVGKNRYLFAATVMTTINLGTLALLIAGLRAGFYLGLFTSAVIGVFQALVNTVGFIKAGGKMRGVGVGFYSAIPLAARVVTVVENYVAMVTGTSSHEPIAPQTAARILRDNLGQRYDPDIVGLFLNAILGEAEVAEEKPRKKTAIRRVLQKN